MTDFRALCAELVGAVENYDFDSDNLEQDWSVLERARAALAQPEPEGDQVCCMVSCHWDGPPPSPHASVSDWFEQEGSKGILYGLRISALPSRNEALRTALGLPESEGPVQ